MEPNRRAAFVATTSSGGSSFQASTCFNNTHRLAGGTYTGNTQNDRAVSVGFKPDLVLVKADTNQIGVGRTSTMSGDASKPMTGGTALSTSRIKSLTATGFTLGTNAQVNSNGVGYHWTALKSGCTMSVGNYTGTARRAGRSTACRSSPSSWQSCPRPGPRHRTASPA